MKTNEISVQRALTKIKNYSVETNKLFNLDYSAVYSNGRNIKTGVKIAEDTVEPKKSLQTATDTIRHLFDLKRAVHASNNVEVVNIPHVGKVTLAEAIIYKNSILPELANLHATLVNDQKRALDKFNRELENYDQTVLSIKGNDKYTEVVKQALLEELETNKPTMKGLTNEINEMKETIDYLTLELDIILSEKNAQVMIELP